MPDVFRSAIAWRWGPCRATRLACGWAACMQPMLAFTAGDIAAEAGRRSWAQSQECGWELAFHAEVSGRVMFQEARGTGAYVPAKRLVSVSATCQRRSNFDPARSTGARNLGESTIFR
jgi:hypothetical protein